MTEGIAECHPTWNRRGFTFLVATRDGRKPHTLARAGRRSDLLKSVAFPSGTNWNPFRQLRLS
jgi:hypothetical protein